MNLAKLVCLGLLMAMAGLGQNIVANPGFENATAAPWVLSPYGGGGNPWAIVNTLFGLGPATGTKYALTGCNSATNCLFPDPSAVGAWMYQDLTTTTGATYTLTFNFTPGNGGGGRTEFQVLWGPSATPLTIGTAGTCGGNCVYRNTTSGSRTYTLITVPNLSATSGSTRLEFLGVQQPDIVGIDDVSVTLAPPPAVGTPATNWMWLALGMGCCGLLAWRRLASRVA